MSRVAITGAGGQLGRQLVAAFAAAGHDVRGLTRADLRLDDPSSFEPLRAWRPDVVVNSAAWTDVDASARDPDRAMRINAHGAGAIARFAASLGAGIVQVSTNEVFDGSLDRPYRPDDRPNPINPYGASKLAGERAVATATPMHLIVRTAWLFGPGGTNFVTKILDAARRATASGSPMRLVVDEIGNPTWTPDLAAAIVSLVASGRTGIVHAGGVPPTSRLGWGRVALEAAGVDIPVEPVGLSAFERASTPPPRAVLEPSDIVPEMAWEPVTRAYASAIGSAVAQP
jgi:dTDP-4-dehydrorhamnose reductase